MTLGKFLFTLVGLITVGFCHAQSTASLQVSLSSEEQPLEDAVVSLTPLDFDAPALPPDEAEIVQENKQYDPYVTVLRVGTKATFPNRDSVQHHLYSVSKPKRFEKPLYASGTTESVLFDQEGVVTLGCNIHDWMVAYVLIVDTPWFAKSGSDGLASLAGIPPGRYRLEVWHPRIKKAIEQEITLQEGDNAPEEFSLKLKRDRRIRRAPTGKSGGY